MMGINSRDLLRIINRDVEWLHSIQCLVEHDGVTEERQSSNGCGHKYDEYLSLPSSLWGEALKIAAYILNKSSEKFCS